MASQSPTDNKRITVALETLGCKLNQAETELLIRQLEEAGCKIASTAEKADIYILNTCTVTHVADRKSRHLLRMAHRLNPQAHLIALGCYADRAGKELSEIEGVDLVAGNTVKINLKQLLADSGWFKEADSRSKVNHLNRTRSFIKAQDGCNCDCTYCIVPSVRGKEKSLSPEVVIAEIRQRAAEGYQEVVLTGTEIGRYQHGGLNLIGLLEMIIKETPVRRLRLSSLQPQEITAGLIGLWRNPRFCPHFHIALQSGSCTVLQRMGRHYSTTDYERAVNLVRSEIPQAAITTDIIVGFPGETAEEFHESLAFCRRMGFARIHVFSYSPREGTRAAGMSSQISPQIKKQRSLQMLALAKASSQNFQSRFLRDVRQVLFEQTSAGLWSGLTDNYIKVYTKSREDLTNQLLPVKLLELRGDGLRGEIVT